MAEMRHSWNFEAEALPHLDAAYNLARWLTRNEYDAQDVVQEAYMRAFRFFGQCRGANVRAWLLSIVRNTSYTWLQHNRHHQETSEFDEGVCGPDPSSPNPEEALHQGDRKSILQQALEALPLQLREVLILRELEGLSYKEIAEVTGSPAGTVMSRLWRARDGLRECLASQANAYGLLSSRAERGYLSDC